jgi:hypothetical protein
MNGRQMCTVHDSTPGFFTLTFRESTMMSVHTLEVSGHFRGLLNLGSLDSRRWAINLTLATLTI